MAKLLTLKWPKCGQVIDPTAHIYIYMCCRLQERGPIFRFIGAETGPKFEVEKDNENNEKTIIPPGVGSQVYVSRGAILTFARAPFVASITGPVCCTTYRPQY